MITPILIIAGAVIACLIFLLSYSRAQIKAHKVRERTLREVAQLWERCAERHAWDSERVTERLIKKADDTAARAVPARAPRAVPNARAVLLDDEAFCRIWRDTREDEPLFLAVQQLLALELVEAIDRMADARLAGRHGELAHAAGGVEHLMTLSNNFDAARTKPEGWTASRISGAAA